MIHLAVVLIITAGPIGAFEYRETPPASLFPFSQAAADPSLPDAISNPAYLPAITYPYLHFSGGMPYTMNGLYASSLRAGYGTRGFGIQAAWDRFGLEQYTEHIVEVNIGYMPVRYVSIGAGAYYYNLSIDTVETGLRTHQADARASIVVSPCRWLDISFLQENIGSIFVTKRRDLMFPEWSAGAALKPVRGFAVVYNINSTAAGYVNSISASATVLKYFSLRAGYAVEATTCAAALSFIYRYIAVSYGIKYHPHLGLTHSVGVTLSALEMNIEPISYGPVFRGIGADPVPAKTNLNICTHDELRALPGTAGRFADRIMKYRKTIGPLTRTGLLQIGMSEAEINELMEHSTGLTPETEDRKTGRLGRNAAEKSQKLLFKKLVGEGLSASTALELSDLAAGGRREALIDRINSLRDIDAGKKRRVIELCTGLR